ncbi:uncharacterized protein LOC117651717 isoform X2 [Thrips palmi]|nr:uncharacterized protein LOC117651717 isoform X2 [Thrips palmi]XP_034251904.1 uncharacterized protein LOC117651717 isoform X2 [Thrips palmi]
MAEVDMMDVNDETMSGPMEHAAEKAEILSEVKQYGVRRLMPVYCDRDPAWVLKLLKAAAPLLEELDIWNASKQHWLLLPTLKRLLRLEVNYWFPVLSGQDGCDKPELPALPPLDPADSPTRLLWLRVCLPRDPMLDLVRRYGASLRELQIFVGTTGQPHSPLSRGWPWTCGAEDLADLLRQCNLSALRRLVLRRPHKPVMTLCGDFTHDEAQCAAQLSAVRRALPSVPQVLCGTCNQIEWKCFEYTIFGTF